jgi:polyisoprenoid-binding protein YceI
MKKNTFILCISLLFTNVTMAQTAWQVNKNTSRITFKIKNAGFNVDGSFKGLDAKINFSPDQLEKSVITASIDASSIDTGIGMRDRHLKNEDYFYVSKYPQITMKSKRFARSQSGDYIGYFDLTMRGITKEIQLPFKFTEKGSEGVFKGEFSLNRRDFQVGSGSWTMSNTATIYLEIKTTK